MSDSEDEIQRNWSSQFTHDNCGRRVWEPPERPTPRSPTEAELDEAVRELRLRGHLGKP
jgi:hypothetical protein